MSGLPFKTAVKIKTPHRKKRKVPVNIAPHVTKLKTVIPPTLPPLVEEPEPPNEIPKEIPIPQETKKYFTKSTLEKVANQILDRMPLARRYVEQKPFLTELKRSQLNKTQLEQYAKESTEKKAMNRTVEIMRMRPKSIPPERKPNDFRVWKGSKSPNIKRPHLVLVDEGITALNDATSFHEQLIRNSHSPSPGKGSPGKGSPSRASPGRWSPEISQYFGKKNVIRRLENDDGLNSSGNFSFPKAAV